MSIEINQKNSFNSLFKYLLFIVLLNSFNVKSQYQDYQPNIPKILPNSPNSTALGDFGKIPVNYCFGKADISIPLYEINLCGLKLPISLNYNTSGIKLSQESTWVGLGWILNAGGCITHQCIGTDDFFDYNKVPYMFSYGYLRSRIISDAASPVIFNPNNKTCVSYNYNKQDNDLYDLEPDNFDFNFAGYGGSLYFNNNPDKSIFNQQYGYEAIIKSNKEYIKAYFNKQKNSWLVFDGNGFKYYFGYNIKSIEITTGHYIPQHTVNANGEIAAKMDSNYDPISHNETSSAWYLNKIEAPNGDSIHFDYEIEEICTVPQTVEDVRIKTSSNTPSGYQNTALDRFNNYSNSNSTIHQCVLKSIIYKSNIIYFRTSNRKDLKSCNTTVPQRLNSVVIKQDNDSICYNFKYSYLGDSTKNTTCRLILDSIIEKKGNDKTNKKYCFTYNKSSLPPKNSRQIDIWGFYNNSFAPGGLTDVLSNSIAEGTLIPTYSIYISRLAEQVLYYGRDRRSDFNSMLHGMLQSIKYPTGGRTNITYELNDFQNTFNLGNESNTVKRLFTNGGGLRVSEIADVLNEEGTEKKYNLRKFEYKNELGMSSGKLLSVPNLYTTYLPYFYGDGSFLNGLGFPPIRMFSYAMIHSSPFAIDLNPGLVGYDRVVESFSNNGVNGKNIYYYNNTTSQGVSMPGIPIYPDCRNGTLNKIIKTDNNNKKQEKVEYTYSYQTLSKNYSQALPFYKTSVAVGDCIVDPMQTSNYLSSYYEIRNYWFQKDNETQTQYFNSEKDSVVNNIHFEYDQINFSINKITRHSSDQKIVEDIIKYPTTCTDNFAAKMIQYNLVNVPIEKSYYVNGVLKLSNKTYYSNKFYNNIMLPEYSTFKQETNNEKVEVEYLQYDIKGNPLYFKGKDNINYCYIWSYNNQYPIAEIKNATYQQVSNAVPGFLSHIEGSANPSDLMLNSLFGGLRNGLPNALITTYTYKPMVGMTSATDPRGVTTYYEYDDFNRLKQTYIIENGEKKILQKYDYHYTNQ